MVVENSAQSSETLEKLNDIFILGLRRTHQPRAQYVILYAVIPGVLTHARLLIDQTYVIVVRVQEKNMFVVRPAPQ